MLLPDQLRPEELLLTLLETGEADAIPAYSEGSIFVFVSELLEVSSFIEDDIVSCTCLRIL
jgi:hypothetical protein